ncbi:MAG: hypothetical protein CMI03_05290 [Oceanospirillaceae bacterium]|uniref:GNAT family N-acetyltransferase n=1 Tax=unclassified Thalassolituus TaxID=2624967 RepID=UPI000C534464|nr:MULTISPECIES: GNAT family N-acetyltransferase [unclassified Thalassolituus]MAS25593.1 hypothetical protein [Oceanospirillaceae bacterium]MBS52146.1 hypothetical protein [Oceanospirillaceae bacterium]|tara:strand:+ start:1403 stop:2314 length:912 start_codon:yes stop_codon:yes gene_type:complete
MEIEVTDWRSHREALEAIRRRVFIDEQKVPEDLEWDAEDINAVHFIAHYNGHPLGCARLLPNGQVGRMAVIPEVRYKGVGSALLKAAEDHYRKESHGSLLKANAQTHAWQFYHRHGFIPEPAFNMDAGIPHVRMIKHLARSGSLSDTFVPGRDNTDYRLDPRASAEGLLQIISSYGPAAINIAITDLALPVWSDASTLSCFTRYLRGARQRSMRIIINEEYSGIADHPLIQLQQRISSRIELKVYSGLKDTLVIMPAYCWISMDRMGVKASLNDRVRVARLQDQYQEWWRSARLSRETRRLRI